MRFAKINGFVWTPIRVKPRCEKKVAGYCDARGFPCYLPLIRKAHRYGRRTVIFESPMFPGYIFCPVDDERLTVLSRLGAVLRRIPVVDDECEARLVSDLNDVAVFEQMASDDEVVINPELVVGTRVRAATGPLVGVEGVIIERQGETHIHVNIEILGQSASVRADIGDFEAI